MGQGGDPARFPRTSQGPLKGAGISTNSSSQHLHKPSDRPGGHPKYIQAQMGHSSIKVTMDTYGHLMKTVNQESAKRLDRAIFEENASACA